MRRLTLQEGYNRLERSSALHTSTRFTDCSTLPFESHNGHRSTIGPFDFQVQRLAFFEEVAILSRMEREQFVKPTCRAVWSEWLDQPHAAIHAQTCACRVLHPATEQGAIQSLLAWVKS